MAHAAPEERSGGSGRRIQMESIVSEHQAALLRYAARLVNSPTLAQDVVQNVFIKLFRGWKSGTHPSKSLKAWLYRVTHNEAVDFVRREAKLRVLHEEHGGAHLADCADGIHCSGSEDEKREMVMAHLKSLHPREQQIVLLRMQEALSYAEISGITGRSEGNVGNILHHAVLKLAKRMKGSATDRGRQ